MQNPKRVHNIHSIQIWRSSSNIALHRRATDFFRPCFITRVSVDSARCPLPIRKFSRFLFDFLTLSNNERSSGRTILSKSLRGIVFLSMKIPPRITYPDNNYYIPA